MAEDTVDMAEDVETEADVVVAEETTTDKTQPCTKEEDTNSTPMHPTHHPKATIINSREVDLIGGINEK